MDLGALFIGGFMLFASGVVLASVVASLDMKKLKATSRIDDQPDPKAKRPSRRRAAQAPAG